MVQLNRFPIKYIRDKAKAAYVKQPSCYVCGDTASLELHHVTSISKLAEEYCKKHSLSIDNVLEWRESFIASHKTELYELVYTLCSKHHKLLHSLFGSSPALSSAEKQVRWLNVKKTTGSSI